MIMKVILFVLVKLPLCFMVLACAARLLYLKLAYDVVEAKCLKSQKPVSGNNGNFVTTYQLQICENNVIEIVELDMITKHLVEVGSVHKLLHKKGTIKDVLKMEKRYSLITAIVVSLLIIILL